MLPIRRHFYGEHCSGFGGIPIENADSRVRDAAVLGCGQGLAPKLPKPKGALVTGLGGVFVCLRRGRLFFMRLLL